MTRSSLAVAAVVALAGALYTLYSGRALLGFMLAGLAGTLASIMLKMPSLSVFGEMASVALESKRAVPRVAQDGGYAFRHTDVEGAIRDVLER